jgi:threonine/homoserine/homoserine lactone efflux protein
MFGIDNYGAFCVAVVVFLLIPGPGNLALIGSTGKGGLKGGAAASLGVIVGDQVLMWSAVAGVAAVLKASPALFAAVQWLGAAYLVYLGIRMLLAKPGAQAVLEIKPGHYFRQACIITLLNPKAIVFYMAFFPQFVSPGHPHVLLAFGVLAATIALITAAYCAVAITLTHTMAERLRANPKAANWLERVAGAMLVGFGAKLAFGR